MKHLLTILFLSSFFSAFSQTGTFDYLTTNRRFTVAGRTVKGISNDSIWLIASADSLVTQYAVKGYVDNHFGPGTSNAYNFNPEQFIVSGYDVSIRFPQDPGEPLFSNSAAFNFTQRHLNFLDSLMLAVGEDTYLDDRDFYYSPDTLNPIRWKAFTLTTDGTGAASWDSANKRLNIPVSSGGGGGTSSPYHLPYNGNANYYLAGDSGLHPLPVTDTSSISSRIDSKLNTSDTTGKWLPIGTFIPAAYVGDSIDYSFTSMTTIYNEAGPGEYTISSNDVSFNKDNLINPFRQLKALDVGGWNNGSYVSFKNTGNVNSTAYTFLRGFVRLKQTVPIIQSLSFRFYNAGVPVSQVVSMVNYGLDKSKVNTYQNITIPMSAFQFSSNTFDEVRLIFGGGSSPDGLYFDLFQFQNATVNENIYVTDVFRVPGTTQVKKILGGQTVDAYTDSVGIAVDTTPLHNQLVQQLAAIQNNTASISLKLNISDTAAMLSPYANKIAANTLAIAGKEAVINAGTTLQYWRGDKTFQTLNTTAVAEGTNLYYTDTRARAAFTLTTTGTSGAATYNSTTGVLNVPQYAASVGTITWLGTTYNINSGNNITLATPTTSNITEGSNLYYTDARARAAISVTGSGTYDNTTGVINITGGSSSGWAFGGNALTNSGTQYIGTNNNTSFRIRTNGTQRMIVDSVGNIGIGTSTPAAKLSFGPLANAAAIHLYDNGATTRYGWGIVTNEMQFFVPDNAQGFSHFSFNKGGDLQSSQTNELMRLEQSGNLFLSGALAGATGSSPARVLTNLGISSTAFTPTAKLSFNTLLASPAIHFYEGGAANRYGMGINGFELQSFVPTGGHFSFNKGGDFQTSGTNEVMRIDASTGSLIIGSTTAVGSSLLTITSTTKGVIFPRMTTTQRDAIAGPAEGLTIYNTTTHQNETWNATTWAH